MQLWQSSSLGLKGFPFISDSAPHLATRLRICASVTCFLVRVPILCHRTVALWARNPAPFFGCWFNGGGGYWWAVPRVCQNSFKSWLFWCLLSPTRCGVITSSSRAAPPSPVFALPPLSLHLSVLINVSAVREGGNEGGGKTSQYKVAFRISAPLKAIPPWRQQGWAVLYQRCQLSAWHKPLDFWWGYFPKDLLDSACFRCNIYSLTGPKLRIFGRQIQGRIV